MDNFQARSLEPLDQEVLEIWGGVACCISGPPVPHLRGDEWQRCWGWSMERRGDLSCKKGIAMANYIYKPNMVSANEGKMSIG